MKKNEIDAVDITRKIRDAHYDQIKDKSTEERIIFYRKKAQKIQEQASKILPGTAQQA